MDNGSFDSPVNARPLAQKLARMGSEFGSEPDSLQALDTFIRSAADDASYALRAALDMRAFIARFNADSGNDLLGLKIGLHSGVCLAFTLNDRLDYFGQTVNIAARVQALADADEIIVTDDAVSSSSGAAGMLIDLAVASSDVPLKGIAGNVRVHRIRSGAA